MPNSKLGGCDRSCAHGDHCCDCAFAQKETIGDTLIRLAQKSASSPRANEEGEKKKEQSENNQAAA